MIQPRSLFALLVCSLSTTLSGQDLPTFDSRFDNHMGVTFTQDGLTAFWVSWNGQWGSSKPAKKAIYQSHRGVDGWSEPKVADFDGNHSDDDPFVSPDGRWLYFVSDRPTAPDDTSNDGNIWRYSLEENLPLQQLSVNSDKQEYSPVMTASGTLYFASNRDGGPGQGDLYVAAADGDGFEKPRALGPQINSATGEWNLWVSADEHELIFEASSRPGNRSPSGDLYFSLMTPTGWAEAIPLKGANSLDSDLMPRLHPSGDILYYTTAPIGGHARVTAALWASLRQQALAAKPATAPPAN